MKGWLAALLAFMVCPVAVAEFPYRGCFDIASRRHHIDLDLLLAVASVESNWNADARSDANAHGVMQIRWPLTARHLGTRRVAELYNPCLNIDLGARYLSELSENYAGDSELVLAAYNYGPTRIKTSGDIPKSVLGYVKKVNRRRQKILQEMDQSAGQRLALVDHHANDIVEVIRFEHPFRAAGYIKSLRAKVPGAIFAVETRKAMSIITVDLASLTPESRYRLSLIMPDL